MNEFYADEEEPSEEDEDSKDPYIRFDDEDSFDDSTGSDADINQFINQKQTSDDEEDL